MPATLEAVRARFLSQVGYVESGGPHGNDGNITRFGKWYGLDGQPWCAMFVSWCFYDAGMPLPASTSKGFAWCPAGAEWFQRQGLWGATPRPGAVQFMRFGARIDHVGWVDTVAADGSPNSIEGNTSSGDTGSQDNGGGVYRRNRHSNIVGYGYPTYSNMEADDMTPDEHKELVRIGTVLDALGKHVHENIDPFVKGQTWWAKGLGDAALDTRLAAIEKKLAAGGGGAAVDVAAIAKAVADELHRRTES